MAKKRRVRGTGKEAKRAYWRKYYKANKGKYKKWHAAWRRKNK